MNSGVAPFLTSAVFCAGLSVHYWRLIVM